MPAVLADGSVTCRSCGLAYTAAVYLSHDCKKANGNCVEVATVTPAR